MALPSIKEYQKKLEGGYNPYQSRRDLLIKNREAEITKASETPTVSLIERYQRIAQGAAGLPSAIAQGTARSVASLGIAAVEGKDATRTPNNLFSKTVFGTDKPFSLSSEGGDFLGMFGASEDTVKKYGFTTGLLLGTLDFIPGGQSKSVITRSANAISKSRNTDNIAKILRVSLAGDESSIQSLSRTLRNVTDKREVEKLIREAGTSPKSVANVNELAGVVKSSGVTREKFLSDLKGATGNPSSRKGQRALNFTARLQRNGMTPESFYDGLVGSKALKRTKVPDSNAKFILGDTTASAKRAVRESTLLRSQLKAFEKGFKTATKPLRKELQNVRKIVASESRKAGQQATKRQKTLSQAELVKQRATDRVTAKKRVDGIKNFQRSLVEHIGRNLPAPYRKGLEKTVVNANNPSSFLSALNRIDKKIATYQSAQILRKQLGKRRSKLAFINKLSDLDSSVVSDMKKTLGLKGSIKNMGKEDLDSMIKEALKRFKFKKARGAIKPKIKVDGKLVNKPKPKTPDTVSDEYIAKLSGKPQKFSVKDFATNTVSSVSGITDIVGVLSTELYKIHPKLFARLRRYDINLGTQIGKDMSVGRSYVKKLKGAKKKMSSIEYQTFDAALKNGNFKTRDALATKYGFQKELDDVIKMKDDIYQRAKEVGFKIGFQKNHFPRLAKSDAASQEKLLKYFNKSEKISDIELAWKTQADRVGRTLTDAEKIKTATMFFKGQRGRIVSLKEMGNMKGRIIDEIPAEIIHLYEDSSVALGNYVQEMNTRIETKKFFDGSIPNGDLLDETAKLDDVFSDWFVKLQSDGLKFTTKEEERIRQLIKARFVSGTMGKVTSVAKDFGYMTLMNSPLNVLSQLPDLAWSIYNAGLIKTTASMGRSLVGRSLVKVGDAGIERVAAEMSNSGTISKWVDTTFRAIGLQQFDMMLKNTTLDSAFTSMIKKANDGDKALREEVELLFDLYPKQADEVLSKLKKGVIDEDTKFLAISKLYDFQPVSLSEVPVKYLEAGNGKIFWQMKTFFTKQMDVVRREVGREIQKGNYVEAAYKMARITALLVTLNATSDEAKSQIKYAFTGKKEQRTIEVNGKKVKVDVEFSDRLVENFFKTFFAVNRYQWENIDSEGFFSSLSQTTIPVVAPADNVYRDVKDIISADDDEPVGIDDLRSVRSIPGTGQLYYWWFGRGRKTIDKKSKNKKRGSKRKIIR